MEEVIALKGVSLPTKDDKPHIIPWLRADQASFFEEVTTLKGVILPTKK